MPTVAILGSGAWGTTLAVLLTNKGLPVTLWEHDARRAREMRTTRENRDLLPGVALPTELMITAELAVALASAEIVIFVVPSQHMRLNARAAAPFIASNALVITASKGFEQHTLARMTQVLSDELPAGPRDRLAVLSGPNLAREIVEGKPAASVIASTHPLTAQLAQTCLTTANLRVYTSSDVIGTELGGALKNIIAIAIGASDGLGFGDNAKASLMTRGLAEIVRLAIAEGGQPLTLAGLAGLGDLIATCSSRLSRNYSLGYELTTTGKPLAELLAGRHSVTEGVLTADSALRIAAKHAIEMPITRILARLFEGEDARTLVAALMQRDPRPEQDRLPQ